MKKKKTNKDYNYKPLTILFDLDDANEKKYLSGYKGKNNGYGVQIKKAVEKLMAEEGSND